MTSVPPPGGSGHQDWTTVVLKKKKKPRSQMTRADVQSAMRRGEMVAKKKGSVENECVFFQKKF